MADLLRVADKDGDGAVSKDEFLYFVLGDEWLDETGAFIDDGRREQLEAQLAQLRQGKGEVALPSLGTVVIESKVACALDVEEVPRPPFLSLPRHFSRLVL